MRLFHMMKPALWMAAGALLGSTVPAFAGNFDCTGSLVQWQSDCSKPAFDIEAHRGAAGAKMAAYEFSEYQLCLKREADDDAQSAEKAIYQAATKELLTTEGDAAIWGFTVR